MQSAAQIQTNATGDIATLEAGALVISLDFELHWGVRDLHPAEGSCHQRLLEARRAIPKILELFEEFGISATWATVGFLFASSKQELRSFYPKIQPEYEDSNLSPYREPFGDGEEDDPVHFAPSILEAIRRTPRQEIASHTFSHYYCLEAGQTHAAFKADLDSSIALAGKYGLRLRSIAFPRNQFNPEYSDLLVDSGMVCYRGNERSWMYTAVDRKQEQRYTRRLSGLADTYINLSGHHLTSWGEVPQPNGLCNVPSSRCLRAFSPRRKYFEQLRLQRIIQGIRAAAVSKKIFHLWWHPEDFGAHPVENLTFLRRILNVFVECRKAYGMCSICMAQAAAAANGLVTEKDPKRPGTWRDCQ